MWIKICANTNLADCETALAAGADAVGFVFAKSPRQVNAEQVQAITAKLPQTLEKIGVFGSLDFDSIYEAVNIAGLTGVQLHGGFSAPLIAELKQRLPALKRLIQSTHVRVGGQIADGFASALLHLRDQASIDNVLVDSRTAVADGGTGVTFDWLAARDSLSALRPKPLIVAGGLTPKNVTEAIATLRPFGVDVASGVEASPGKKDPERVRDFINAARASQ